MMIMGKNIILIYYIAILFNMNCTVHFYREPISTVYGLQPS